MRNMSFMLTIGPFSRREKLVTRRNGWGTANVDDVDDVDDVVMGCEQCQGLKKGEKIVRMGPIRFASLRWEPLRQLTDDLDYGRAEMILEGFPDMHPADFVAMYCKANKCTPDVDVHRMEYEYITREE